MGNITFNEAFGRTLTGHPSVPLLLKVAAMANEAKQQKVASYKDFKSMDKQAGLGQMLGATLLGGMAGGAYGASKDDVKGGMRTGAGAGAGTIIGKDLTGWALNRLGMKSDPQLGAMLSKYVNSSVKKPIASLPKNMPIKMVPSMLRIPLLVLGSALGGITGGAIMANRKATAAPRV